MIGSGEKVVDVFIDPMCPYCKQFEGTSGEGLFSDAAAGVSTVRVHPLAILNRLSEGTSYSTRAAGYLTLVAAEHPTATQAFLQALLREQPQENTPGLADADLARLARSVGADLDFSTAHVAPYKAWVDEHTELATSGPIEASTEIPAVQQVPTVIVNGAVFTGSSGDADAFASFYISH